VLPQRREAIRRVASPKEMPRRFQAAQLTDHLHEAYGFVADLVLQSVGTQHHVGVELAPDFALMSRDESPAGTALTHHRGPKTTTRCGWG